MRRLTALVMLVLVFASLPLSNAMSAAATNHPPACKEHDSRGVCVVAVAEPSGGSNGTPGSAPDQAGGQVRTPAVCTADGIPVPCQDGNAWWVQSMGCYVSVVSPPPPQTDPVWEGHTNGAVYSCVFLPMLPGTGGIRFWSATSPGNPNVVDPVDLARRALKTLLIPSPTVGRYPAGRLKDGRPYTVVNAYTWYWSDAASFTTLTARATAGGVWSQVTVTPSRLTFTPGDGSPPVSCAGPGVAWQRGDGVWAGSPTGCDYRYPHSSIHQPVGVVTATYGIRWQVTWTSSTGAAGTLPGLTTTATSTFAVAEVESVVVS
jgi:hypothetical protein